MSSNCFSTEALPYAGDGYVVVGSDDGQIRLYSEKSLTRANTAIPGLGASITSVDVTYDGKWVLATTNKYLMVVKTVFKASLLHSTNLLGSLEACILAQEEQHVLRA